jgi:small conductance mechanosensitive channel
MRPAKPRLTLLIASGLALCGSPRAAATQVTLPPDTSVGADSLAREPVTDQRAEQDEAIRNALQGVFDRVPGLSRVDVRVDAGVVQLEGTVPNADLRTRAVELAAQMEGVVFVDNRVRESTSLEEQLQPTWDRLRERGYSLVAKLPLMLVALVIVVAAVWAGALLRRWSGPAFLQTRNPFLQSLIRRFLQGLVVVLGLILALDLLDATALAGALVGTAGLAGLAVGFAFLDIVENYLAGTILAVSQPFAKNDRIRVGEFEGKVVRLTPRETILMSIEGNHIRLPNSLIFRSPTVNFTRNPLRRFAFDLGLGSGDDLLRAREVAVSALTMTAGVLTDPPPEAQIVALGDSTVTVRHTGWVDQRQTEFERVRSEAIRMVKLRLEAAGLTLPAPEYLLRMGTDTGPAPQPALDDLEGQSDVSVDRALDEQIEVERRASDEPDLLDAEPPR